MDEDRPNVESADYWRERANEARDLSEWMIDNNTKVLMLEIAETYELIAKAYEGGEVRINQPRDLKQG